MTKEYGSIQPLSCGLGILSLDLLRKACSEFMSKTFADCVCHSSEIWEFQGWQSLELDISQWTGVGAEGIPDQTAPSVGPSKPSHVFIQFEGHFVWLNDEDKGGKKKKGLLRWI